MAIAKKKGQRRGFKKKYILLTGFLILALLVLLIWQSFFSYSVCEDSVCFSNSLKECSKSSYVGGEENIFKYRINGKEGNLCVVEVTLIKGDFNKKESQILEGLSMVCKNPLGINFLPESNLRSCHGELKEEIQYLIIEKLHGYIAENIGRINLEILDIPGA